MLLLDWYTSFLYSSPLLPNPPQILCFTMLFNRPHTIRSAPARGGIYTSSNICSVDPLDSASQSIGSAVFAQLVTESPYTLQCALKRD